MATTAATFLWFYTVNRCSVKIFVLLHDSLSAHFKCNMRWGRSAYKLQSDLGRWLEN